MAHSLLPPFGLQGEELLEAYTHRSVRNDDSSDKLAFLGERLLNFAIARHWYENLPQISSQDLQEKTEQTLSDDLLRACIDKYELQRNLRRASQSDIGPDDARDFLNVYIGLLYTQAGVPGVQRWVSALIDPNESTPYNPFQGNGAGPASQSSLTAPLPSDPAPPLPPMPGPSQTSHSTPTLPPYSSPPGTPTSINASSGLVTLARFNEHVTQRLGQTVTWKVSDSGEAHRLLWTMTVLLDGQPKGTGQGHSQKVAKEQAIREAWTALGWDLSAPDTVNSQHQLLPPLSPLSPSVTLQSPSSLNAFVASSMNGDSSSISSSVTVAGFNEVAAKQHLQIAWDYARSGDPHMPTWRVTCLVNGNHMGTGVGRNKKESMLAAARDAWRNMGWP